MKRNLLIVMAILTKTTFTIAQVPSYVPTNGLVSWYPFDGNANDQSVNGNNGIVYGATLTTDRFGNPNAAYDYNGINNCIYVSGSNSLNNIVDTMSCSIWIYAPPFTSTSETAISKIDTSSGFWNLITNPSYQCEFRVFNGMGAAIVLTQVPIVNSNWHNIVSVVSSTNRSIYVDGILNVTTPTAGYSYGLNTSPLTIGVSLLPTGTFFSWFLGKIDDIGIWNRPLTLQEISNLRNSNVGLNELTEENEIIIFPNPTHDRINIHTNKDFIGSTYIITDVSGKEVLSGKINSFNPTVDIAGLTGGVYCFSIDNNSKQSFSIVKN